MTAVKTNYRQIHLYGRAVVAGLPQFKPFNVSIANVREATEGAETLLKIFNVYREGALKNPNNGDWWEMMRKVKGICLSIRNRARGNKQFDIAAEYEKVYRNQMDYPPKGEHWRKYNPNNDY